MRKLLIAAAAAVTLTGAGSASAAVVTRTDAAGRRIELDVRAAHVDVAWYAGIMRHLLHGDEIENVVVRIAPRAQIVRACGASAVSCYLPSWHSAVMVVPAGKTADVVHLVAHEYGHHVDTSYGLTEGVRDRWEERDPAAIHWWAVRHIAALLDRARVAYTYRLGWERSIGEIFAEDYAVLNTRTPTRIRWLASPTSRIFAALRTDLRHALAAH